MRIGAPSFRTRILIMVFTVAVVPMALMGLWLTRSASRSGQELLHSRLEQALDRSAERIGDNWLRQRSDILFLGEDDTVQRALLAETGGTATREVPATLRRQFEDLDVSVLSATILDLTGQELWTLTRNLAPRDPGPALGVEFPIYRRFPARELGKLEVRLALEGLIEDAGMWPELAGMVLSAMDTEGDISLLPLPFDARLLAEQTFSWGGDEWLTARRRMIEPPLLLVAAVPLSPVVGPFEDAARRGTGLLAAVALSAILAAYLLTRRLTHSLERLAAAAQAVSRGEFDAEIENAGTDEVGRVAHAFNRMMANLRRTLRELADRERLAAVGEFAASLAHEVRNPLTAIRIDLQRVEERLPSDSPLREPQSRALREISRLDDTVSETLDVARTGRWRMTVVDLRAPLRAAADAAAHAFAERQGTLDLTGLDDQPLVVLGDASALEQLFLNLLLNAAAALGPGGRAWIEVGKELAEAVVAVRDSGTGIAPEMLDNVFQPLFTTRPDGTGLGLTVARRIVDEHGGRIEIESAVGEGTTVRIRVPLEPGSGGIPGAEM